jgi:ELWxxDGT repeat protein
MVADEEAARDQLEPDTRIIRVKTMKSSIKIAIFTVMPTVALVPLASLAAEQAVPMTSTKLVRVEYFAPAACNGRLVFAGNDPDRGCEPWVTDGTPSGTKRLRDIWPGPRSSDPFGFASLRNRVLFWAADAAHGRELWITDGSESGTRLLKDIVPGERFGSIFGPDSNDVRPGRTAERDGLLYFFALTEDGRSHALYRSDGTPEGTVCLAPAGGGPAELVAGEDGVYVFNLGNRIWKSDGTPAGTVSVAKVRKWERDSSSQFNSPDREISWRPVCIGRTAFFAGCSETDGIELWKTDGTEAGTVMVRDIRKGFGAGYGESDRSSYPQWLTVFNNELYFVATDDVDTNRGRELWKTDGTEAGTVMVKDINPGRESSSPAQLVVWNNALYFTASSDPKDTYHRRTLWRTDGTEEGTRQAHGVSYVPRPPAYRSPPFWPLAWAIDFHGHLFTVGNPFDCSFGVAKMQPGSSVLRVCYTGGRENEYRDPRWTRLDDGLVFIAGEQLWKCSVSPQRRR